MEAATSEHNYIKEIADGKYFCFTTLKQEIEKLPTDGDKIIHLLKAKTAYRQEGGKILEQKNTATFEEKIDFEMEFIKLRYEVQRNYSEETRVNPGYQIKPIKVNCNVNQLGDLFYQLLNETKVGNKPIMETTTANLARIICTCFLDKDENELSLETIKTILSKAHPEKRPKHEDRLVFK